MRHTHRGIGPLIAALWMCIAAASDEDPEAGKLQIWQDGYFDVGWFDAQGEGPAYERDVAHRVLGPGPDERYEKAPWVFYGDPWANAINSQGDSADLGLDRTNIDRFDPIASGGKASFIVNRFHHGISIDRGAQLGVRARVNVEPRTGKLGTLGDIVSMDTAYIVWRPLKNNDLKLYVGRLESGFGREYRVRHASKRVGVTPSIMSRYLVGLQTGVRARGTVRRWFGYSVAFTNGGTVTERFGHLNNDLDVNGVPTVTARVGATIRRPVRIEVGLSGQTGPQDAQPDPRVVGWQVGADARIDAGKFGLTVEGAIVHQPGDTSAQTESLDARGGYAQLEYRPQVEVALLARVDWRDAELFAWPNLYVSDVLRVTGGLRVDANQNLAMKAEYLHLAELRPGTKIVDDVFTTSVVFRYKTSKKSL